MPTATDVAQAPAWSIGLPLSSAASTDFTHVALPVARFEEAVTKAHAETGALLEAIRRVDKTEAAQLRGRVRANLLEPLDECRTLLQAGLVPDAMHATRRADVFALALLTEAAERLGVDDSAFKQAMLDVDLGRTGLASELAVGSTLRPSTGVLQRLQHYKALFGEYGQGWRMTRLSVMGRGNDRLPLFDTHVYVQGSRQYFENSPSDGIAYIEGAGGRPWTSHLREKIATLPDGVHRVALRVWTDRKHPLAEDLADVGEVSGHVCAVVLHKSGSVVRAALLEGAVTHSSIRTKLEELLGAENVVCSRHEMQSLDWGCRNLAQALLQRSGTTPESFAALTDGVQWDRPSVNIELPPHLRECAQTRQAQVGLIPGRQAASGFDNVQVPSTFPSSVPEFRYVNLSIAVDSMRSGMVRMLSDLHAERRPAEVRRLLDRIRAFDPGFDRYFADARAHLPAFARYLPAPAVAEDADADATPANAY